MKNLFYEQNECINEDRLLDFLFDLGLNIEVFADHSSDFQFINLSRFKTMSQLPYYAKQISIQEERLPLTRVALWLTESATAQSISAKISKVASFLDTTAGEVRSSLSRRELFTLLAINHSLDLLNICSLGFTSLLLSSTYNERKSQAAAAYRQQQPTIYGPQSINTEIRRLVNALQTAFSETPQPLIRFLQTLTCLQSGGQTLEVVLGELKLANDEDMISLQTNMDEMSPHLLSYDLNQLFVAGTLNVYQAQT